MGADDVVAAGRDPLGGTERTSGHGAARGEAETARRARFARDERPYPLDGLVERIQAGEKPQPELAFAADVLEELLRMRDEEQLAFQAERRGLGAAGVSVSQLDRALDTLAKRRREATKAEEERTRKALTEARRGARTREEKEAAEAREAARAAAPEALRWHYGEPATVNGCTYDMVPDRTWLERWRGDTLEVEDLAEGSIRVRAHVHEVEGPGAAPRTSYELSAKAAGEPNLRPPVHVLATNFRRMDWIEELLPGFVVLETGRREHLRIAIEKLSPSATRVHRYCYRGTGWFIHEGAPAYVHTGGAIGPAGPIEGVRAEPRGLNDKVGLFSFPVTGGADRVADLRAVARLFDIEPAHVAIPIIGLCFRPVMGGARLAAHVWGLPQTGKSRLSAMFTRLFGAKMHYKNAPASWYDSPASILSKISRVGDAVAGIVDMQPDTDPNTVAMVFRALFNNSPPGRQRRDGGDRDVGSLRASILSDGERSVRGPSLPSRVCALHLERRPTDFDATGLEALAASGQLARGMAHFVEDYAPRYATNLPNLPALERENAARWELGLTDREAELFNPFALGLQAILRLLRAADVISSAELETHRLRASEALRIAAQGNRSAVQQQHPGVVALDAIGAAIRSCSNDGAHVGAARLVAKRRVARPPPHPERWGYSLRGVEPQGMGARVGVRLWEDPAAVVLDLGVCLAVAKKWAPRVCGVELPAGTARELEAHIKGAGLVVRQDEGRPEGKARVVTGEPGTRNRLEGVAVSPASLGIDTDDDPPEFETDDTESGRHEPPEPRDF